MTAELKTAANIKYISIKMKKKLKNNSEIVYIIKDAGEVCVKILLFLLCCENPDKIDFEFMKNSIIPAKTKETDDAEILRAVDFWKDKNILDYEITSSPNVKGANMDNIINIILNISRDIDILDGGEQDDSIEFDRGLGIYKEKHEQREKIEQIEQIVGRDDPGAPQNIYEPEFDEPNETNELNETDEQTVGRGFPDAPPEEEPPPVSPRATAAAAQSSPVSSNSNSNSGSVSGSVSIEKLSEALESKEEFYRLYIETQKIMRIMFNTTDLGIIYNLYETENIEADLILKLAKICAEQEKNNIRYLEKVALGMAADGIKKMSQYEIKLEEMRKITDFEEKIKKLFDIGERKLAAKERNHIKRWLKEFDFSDDVLTEGYRRCIKQIGNFSADYINKIYIGWHEKGFRTLDDINSEFGANSDNINYGARKKYTGIDLEQFFAKETKKRKERAEKL